MHTALQQALGHGAADLGHAFGGLAIAAVAQERMGRGACDIEHRGAVAVDAKTAQLEWRAEYNDGKVPMCSYSYRKASNMWNKLWMMHKNRAHNLSQYSADMVSSSIISKARPPALRAYRPAPRTPCTCHVPCA